MSYPLYNYIMDVNNLKQNPPSPPEMKEFSFKRAEEFKQKIVNIDNMPDMEIIYLIRDNIDKIITDVLNGDEFYNQIFLNKKFIVNFNKFMASVPIDHTKRVCCNKLFYDYQVSEMDDKFFWDSFMRLSKTVNNQYIQSLATIGINEDLASLLTTCRFSSTKERINVQRLNFVIEQQDPNLMTEQMIIYIYEKLFDKISDLFIGTMLESYTDEEFDQFGESFSDVYGNVGLAVLTILNNMPLDAIRQVLISYYSEWNYIKTPVRFSLKPLSADFSRVCSVAHSLNAGGYYRIP